MNLKNSRPKINNPLPSPIPRADISAKGILVLVVIEMILRLNMIIPEVINVTGSLAHLVACPQKGQSDLCKYIGFIIAATSNEFLQFGQDREIRLSSINTTAILKIKIP